MRKNLRLLLGVSLLIILDQVIKIYIDRYMMSKEFDLIGNILGFRPYLNIKYSWINSIGNLGIGLLTHIILVVLMLVGVFLAYDFITWEKAVNKLVYILFSFLFAGGFCSLIDKVVWGGSLDYMWLKGFFIFDLKDVYLTIFEVGIILLAAINYKGFKDIKARMLWKDFTAYFKNRYLKR